ncbi:MAG TPA: hypothetical protein VMU78_03275, partial [Methylocella sp.]|nr:hypothetical protein [Methylocella sp.]
ASLIVSATAIAILRTGGLCSAESNLTAVCAAPRRYPSARAANYRKALQLHYAKDHLQLLQRCATA